MKPQNKRRTMMILMALSLATAGCGKKNDYKTNGFEKVQEIMDKSEFYQKKSYDGTYEERYAPFYENYLNRFAKYMSEDQYNSFLGVVRGMDTEEPYDFVNTYLRLEDMFDITPTKEGRCFFKCFNSRVMSEGDHLSGLRGLSKITLHLTTIRSVVHNDDAFFKSIYSGNIDKVIDCICKNTGFKNRELVEELILKMDLYNDIAESEEYMDIQLKETYEARIREIIGLIIESKCAKDEYFNNCLYARLLKESSYFDKDKYEVVSSISIDEFYFGDYSGDESYCIYDLDSQYLYEDISLEEIRRIHSNKIIYQAMHPSEDNMYAVEDTMQLLMSIIDVDILTGDLSDSNNVRLAMYENLRDYFTSEDDFNTFIVKLQDDRDSAFERYFDILIKRIEEDGINYDDFIRYLCFVNYNKERTYTTYHYWGTYEEMEANRLPDEEIRAMKESEWDPIVYTFQDNFVFWSFPYHEYFAKVESALANNDLGYEQIFNPDCEYVWDNGEISLTDQENSSVLSSYVNPKTMEYNGTNIIYYEIPIYYEDALAVETFYNIDDEFITRDVKGFKTTIEDPKTGEEKLVFVSGLADTLEDAEPIRFILDYNLFMEAKKNLSAKGLYLAGGYYV